MTSLAGLGMRVFSREGFQANGVDEKNPNYCFESSQGWLPVLGHRSRLVVATALRTVNENVLDKFLA